MMLYLLYRIGFFLGRILPIKALYVAASVSAYLYFVFSEKDKSALRKNLRIILGEGVPQKEVDGHVLRVFINFAKYLADFFKFSKVDEKYIRENIELNGLRTTQDHSKPEFVQNIERFLGINIERWDELSDV